MKKLLFYSVLFTLASVGVARFCHHKTAGFQTIKIQDNFCTKEVTNYPENEKAALLKSLSQKFYYLNRGLQSFVFVSEDGSCVLKILNNLHQRRLFWLNLLPSSLVAEKIAHNQERLQKGFNSYHIAYNLLKEETGLLFIHLEPTSNLRTQVNIVDKIGITHTIDLDQTAFLVQKRATLVFPALDEMMQKGQTFKAKEAICSLMQLIRYKFKEGIADNDPLIRTNFGFIEGKAVQIDVGPLSLDPKVKNPAIYKQEMQRITASLKEWLNKNYPELLECINDE